MSIALPILFGMIGLGSIVVIWHTIAANLDAIVDLRRRVAMPEYGSEMIVTFHDSPAQFGTVASVRRPRQVRVPAPKPVTHRLHQFAKARTAA